MKKYTRIIYLCICISAHLRSISILMCFMQYLSIKNWLSIYFWKTKIDFLKNRFWILNFASRFCFFNTVMFKKISWQSISVGHKMHLVYIYYGSHMHMHMHMKEVYFLHEQRVCCVHLSMLWPPSGNAGNIVCRSYISCLHGSKKKFLWRTKSSMLLSKSNKYVCINVDWRLHRAAVSQQRTDVKRRQLDDTATAGPQAASLPFLLGLLYLSLNLPLLYRNP